MPVYSHSIVQVTCSRFGAGADIEDDFRFIFFPEDEDDLFGDKGGYTLERPTIGYLFSAIGDWAEPFDSSWQWEIDTAGMDDLWSSYGQMIEEKAESLLSDVPDGKWVTFTLIATSEYYWDEDGGDSEWVGGLTCDMSEIVSALKNNTAG